MPRRWYEDYERGRPGYPPGVVAVGGLPSSATVLELAAGTGKLTRLLDTSFARVVALEPDPHMRRLLAAHCPRAGVTAGRAERIPLADDSVDAVFVAQAFHWFDNETALAEIARVLRPQGALVVMWNVPSGPVVPSLEHVEVLLQPWWPDDFECPLDMLSRDGWAPAAWRLPFAQARFEEIRESHLPNPQTLDAQGLLAFFGSMGWVASLPDEERLPLIAAVESQLSAVEYVLPWETRIQWTRLSTPE